MRLIACPTCHAQYDLDAALPASGTLEGLVCRCGEALDPEPPKPVDAEVHRCAACGALARFEESACSYCGAAIVRDPRKLTLICPECYARNSEDARFCCACGVGFRPEALPMPGEALVCPACGTNTRANRVADLPLHECLGCRGLWVPGANFDELMQRAVDRRNQAEAAAEKPAPRARGANPAQQAVAYRRCPVCQQQMLRRNFRKTSGVIVDSCKPHGTWLDANELEQIAGFIASGGKPAQSQLIAEQEAKDERDAREARRASPASSQMMRSTGLDRPVNLLDVDRSSSLLELLISIFD